MTVEGWRDGILGQDALVVSGQHVLAEECTDAVTAWPYLTGPADFPGGEIRATKYVRAPKVMCQSGDTLVTVKGSGTGKLARADRAYCISRQLAAVRARTWAPDFVYHVLVSHQTRFQTNATGLIPGLGREDLLGLPVQVPPLPEQRKIAAILSSVDAAIEATEAVIEQLQVVKKAMMAELLTRGIPGRHTKFKMTEIGEVPEAWEVTTLGAVCVPDGLQTGPFGSQLKASEYVNEGVPLVMPKDIRERRIDPASVARVTPEKAATLPQHQMRPGDVVFGRRGEMGRCALVRDEERGWLCGTGCLRARPSSAVQGDFLVAWLSATTATAWITDHAVGQTMLNINTEILAGVPVPLPGNGEQEQIAGALEAVEWQRLAVDAECQGLRRLKGALMTVLLTGDLRVKPVEATA